MGALGAEGAKNTSYHNELVGPVWGGGQARCQIQVPRTRKGDIHGKGADKYQQMKS